MSEFILPYTAFDYYPHINEWYGTGNTFKFGIYSNNSEIIYNANLQTNETNTLGILNNPDQYGNHYINDSLLYSFSNFYDGPLSIYSFDPSQVSHLELIAKSPTNINNWDPYTSMGDNKSLLGLTHYSFNIKTKAFDEKYVTWNFVDPSQIAILNISYYLSGFLFVIGSILMTTFIIIDYRKELRYFWHSLFKKEIDKNDIIFRHLILSDVLVILFCYV